MRRRVIAAGFAVVGVIAMTTAASAQVCVLGIFGAAIYVATTEKRELTQKEAMTCGLSRLVEDKKSDEAKASKDKKSVRAAKAAAKKKTD
ncbi:MAG: hypothetical protein JSR72_18110 [Proteobacteria bacterium]|nr:hypothetical protein [Pseudomonadota bacterium]